MIKDKINIFSFFSGAGFLDLGFELTNHFDVVYVNEFHKAFNDVYKYARAQMHIPSPQYGHHVGDVNELLDQDKLDEFTKLISESKSRKITGIIGGPPCPDFSVAGKNRGKDGENGKLSGIYTSLICQTKPDFFLFENVKGLYRTVKHREFFESLKMQFRNVGYVMTEQLINAIEFGVPQNRERIILIGIHQNLIQKLGLNAKLEDFNWESRKLFSKDILNANWPKTDPYKEDGFLPKPTDIPEELTIQYWWDKNAVETHPNSKKFFTPKAGLIKFQSIEEGDDKKKCYKRLHRWRYSPTAAYGNNEVHIHPYRPRRISVSEALAIQSLPKEFVLPDDVSLTDAFKTIGNGVPFLAAKGIAQTIFDYLNK